MRNAGILILAVTLLMAGFGCGEPQKAAPAPPEVVVATPVIRDVVLVNEFNGTTQAFESVDIRARVQGYLKEIRFTSSSYVEAGEVLFVIEQEPFIARRNRARASLKSAEAALRRAESDLDRLEQAVKTNAVSQQEVTRARAERDQADAARLQALAELQVAEIELDYTTIETPIPGLVSRNYVDRGNLVGQGEATLLATVRRLDPIFAYFEINERLMARILEEREGYHGPADTAEEEVPATLIVRETGREIEGMLDSFENAVDTGTGTIMLRGIFANPEALVFPGFYVTVRIANRVLKDAVLVQEKAVGTDLGGKYLYLVGEGDVVEQRYVELGASQDDGSVVVLEGLEGGELYVLEGLLRARPGLPVTPKSAGQGG